MNLKNENQKNFSSFESFLEFLGRLKMMRKLGSSLNSSVANVANFLRVEEFPLFVMKLVIELFNELRVNEVQKGIPHVTVILN